MKSLMNLIYFFLVILNYANSEYVVYNFKTNINLQEITDDNYIQKAFNQLLYTEVNIGEPSQLIPMTLKTWQYPTFVVSKDVTDKIKVKFDQTKSKTYKKDYESLISGLPKYDFNKGYLSLDTLNTSVEIKDLSFMLATEMSVGTKNISGGIGLAKENTEKDQLLPKKTHFIDQLVERKLITKKILGFTYDTEYEGRLIFGGYLYEVEKNYQEKDMNEFDIDTDVSDEHNNMWMMKFNLNCLSGPDNEIIYEEKDSYGFFYIETGLIIGSTVFKNNFAKSYFEKKGCKNTTVDASSHLTVYYCTEESQFADFPNITFKYPGKYNFTFTKDELFVKRGKKYYFQIVFEIFTDDIVIKYWKIGQLFLKKYSIFFKQEDRGYKMSYYLTQKFPNPGLSTQTIVIIVLSVVVFILSVGIIVYFVYFFPKRKKKRANELADDYEYQSKEETKDKLMVNE